MKRLIVITTLLAVASLGFSQEQTVEDVFLQTTVEKEVIRALIAENTRSEKIKALDFLEDMIVDGRVGENDEDVINLLDELSSEGIDKEVRNNNRLVNYYPEVRRRSAQLLGEIGGELAKQKLLDIVQKDFEPMVLAEAVYSLGLIGSDESGYVEEVIADLVRVQDVVRPDNNFAFASIAAIRNLVEKSGDGINPVIFSSLIQIAQGNYIRQVREAANQLLDDLRKRS
jgi:HEAT repeat protein